MPSDSEATTAARAPVAFDAAAMARAVVAQLSGFILGDVRSDFNSLSAGIDAVLSQSRMRPHISARLLPYMMGFTDLFPKLTPLIL